MTRNSKKRSFPAIAALIVALVLGGVILVPKLTHAATASGKASLELTAVPSKSVEVGNSQEIRWTSHNYAPKTVTVNLIRKVADNPASYELVRTIADSTRNDGTATWVPAVTDTGTGLSLEIGCAPSKAACTAAVSANSDLAVINTNRYSYTASIFKAVEALMNK